MKKILAGLLFSLGLLLLSIFLYMESRKTSIRIGLNPWPGYEPIKLAETLGYFEKNGLDVKVMEYQSLNDVKVALLRGQIDIMCSTVIEAIELKSLYNLDTKIILVADYSNGADVIQSKELKSIKELEGHKVGLEIGTISEFLLRRAAQIHGLDMSKVKLEPMEQHDMLQAFRNGKVDAVVSYPPVSISIEKELTTETIFSSSQIPYEVVDILAARANLIKENPELISQIHKTWGDVLNYLEKNRSDAISRMARRQGISDEEFSKAIDDLKLVPSEQQEKILITESNKLKEVIRGFFEVLKEKNPDKFDPNKAGDLVL